MIKAVALGLLHVVGGALLDASAIVVELQLRLFFLMSYFEIVFECNGEFLILISSVYKIDPSQYYLLVIHAPEES